MKKLILFFITFILVTTVITGCFSTENKAIIKNLEDSSLKNFSMYEFFNKLNITSFPFNDKNLKIEEFRIGLTDDKKIRVMVINIVKESDYQRNRYSILYNRDIDYLKVKQHEIKNGRSTEGLNAEDFFKKFDNFKNMIDFPKGNYKYYAIELMCPYNIKLNDVEDKEIYVIGNKGIFKSKGRGVKGLYFMVYGEPIGGGDRPTYYVLEE